MLISINIDHIIHFKWRF